MLLGRGRKGAVRWVGSRWGSRGYSVAMGAVLRVRHHWGTASPCLPGPRGLAEMGSAALKGCPGPVGEVPARTSLGLSGIPKMSP